MRLISTLVLTALLVGRVALAQGFLTANNQTTTPIALVDYYGGTSNVVGAPGCPLGSGSLVVTLWIATNGAPIGALTQVAIGTNSSSTLPLAYGTFNLGNPLVLPMPWDGTFQVELLYRVWAWSSGLTTWAQATGTYYGPGGYAYPGQSALLTNFTLGTGIQPPPPTFGPGLLQGIQIGIIPEPSACALLGIGLAALLGLRARGRFD